MTLSEWFYKWLEVYKKPKVKKKTYRGIEASFRLHVSDDLKNTDISKLKVFDIDVMLSSLGSSRTAKLLYDNLVSCLFKAYCLDLLEKDISKLIEPVRYSSVQGSALSYEELDVFLKSILGHKLENLFYFYLLTGVRRHEALILRWGDINYNGGYIVIRGTKTLGSYRTIPITEDLKVLLKSIRYCCDRVFPFNDDYVTHVFKKYCPNHRLHDLRHTFATLCAESNVHPTATQRMLGHSKIDTTMRIYTHVTSAYVQKESEKIRFPKK